MSCNPAVPRLFSMRSSFHNPDQYMADLRQILAQGRKRLGILIGAGAPADLRINKETKKLDADGDPLIPTIDRLTSLVLIGLVWHESYIDEIIAGSMRDDDSH